MKRRSSSQLWATTTSSSESSKLGSALCEEQERTSHRKTHINIISIFFMTVWGTTLLTSQRQKLEYFRQSTSDPCPTNNNIYIAYRKMEMIILKSATYNVIVLVVIVSWLLNSMFHCCNTNKREIKKKTAKQQNQTIAEVVHTVRVWQELLFVFRFLRVVSVEKRRKGKATTNNLTSKLWIVSKHFTGFSRLPLVVSSGANKNHDYTKNYAEENVPEGVVDPYFLPVLKM